MDVDDNINRIYLICTLHTLTVQCIANESYLDDPHQLVTSNAAHDITLYIQIK
jgi:hypothetical protein